MSVRSQNQYPIQTAQSRLEHLYRLGKEISAVVTHVPITKHEANTSTWPSYQESLALAFINAYEKAVRGAMVDPTSHTMSDNGRRRKLVNNRAVNGSMIDIDDGEKYIEYMQFMYKQSLFYAIISEHPYANMRQEVSQPGRSTRLEERSMAIRHWATRWYEKKGSEGGPSTHHAGQTHIEQIITDMNAALGLIHTLGVPF